MQLNPVCLKKGCWVIGATNPSTMQLNPTYTHVTQDIIGFFSEKLPLLHEMGLHDTIVDVGFGFGKTPQHNLDPHVLDD